MALLTPLVGPGYGGGNLEVIGRDRWERGDGCSKDRASIAIKGNQANGGGGEILVLDNSIGDRFRDGHVGLM